MNTDDAFVRAILAAPADDAARLVYADWLDERGDPRGEYLRLELALAAAGRGAEEAGELRRRMRGLRQRIDPLWQATFDQPRLLRANPTPFAPAWWGVELPGYRREGGTYVRYEYGSLPPLPVERFHGDYGWLREATLPPPEPEYDEEFERTLTEYGSPAEWLADLLLATDEAGVRVAEEYRLLLTDADLQRRIRSCTDCYFDIPRRPVFGPAGDDAHLLRFYSDSQGCVHWYLYGTDDGYRCVVAGDFFGGHPGSFGGRDDADGPVDADSFVFVAPSLEAFVYRWWIENEIWYALCLDHDPLTADEAAYLRHYRPD
jgi:uncharacterized protein (TIGR02996 family)